MKKQHILEFSEYEIYTTGEYGFGQLFNHIPKSITNKEFEINNGLSNILEPRPSPSSLLNTSLQSTTNKKLISMIDLGEDFTVFVTHDNLLYVNGLNENNIFNISDFNQTKKIVKEPYLISSELYNKEEITKISCGASHFIFITNNKTIYSFGLQKYFTKINYNIHFDENYKLNSLQQGNEISLIGSGESFSVVIINNYFIYLGVKPGARKSFSLKKKQLFNYFPIKDKFAKIKQLACGRNHFILLTEDNELYGLGKNNFGQLGNNLQKEYLDSYCKLTLPNNNNFKQIQQIACGFHFTMIICDNKLFACGNNQYFQFGISSPQKFTTLTEILIKCLNEDFKVTCGGNHTIIHLMKSNQVMCAGFNGSGELGIGHDGMCLKQFKLYSRKFDKKITHVLCGRSVSIIVTQTGLEIALFKQKLLNHTLFYKNLTDLTITSH
ncbi:hypothetical protein ABK040_014761 [Willaertia magna]